MTQKMLRASGRRAHLLACVVMTGLIAGPSAMLVEHARDHERSVHGEASHPDASPHFDREEHLKLDRCVGCLAGFPLAEESGRFLRAGIAESSADSLPLPAPLVCRARLSSSPRAPPA